MSLKIEIEVPITTILAVQDAAKQDTSPASLQLARNLSFQAPRKAVEQLPYDINRKGGHLNVKAPAPGSKRPPSSIKPTSLQTKKAKTESNDIHVNVKDNSGTTSSYEIRNDDLIGVLKSKIEARLGIPRMDQRLLCGGRQMEDFHGLDEVSPNLRIVPAMTKSKPVRHRGWIYSPRGVPPQGLLNSKLLLLISNESHE